MAQRSVTVGSPSGLHARPAKLLVEAAARQPVRVRIGVAGRPPVPADSMLSVLSLGAGYGTEVTLHAEGEGADGALDYLADLVSRDLDAGEPGEARKAGEAGERAGA